MRLFVALALPDSLRLVLAGLAGGVPGARWVPAANLHLTLRFIGEVQSWQAQEIDDALAAVRSRGFELSLAGIGTFESAGRVTTLWARAERNERLSHLQQKIETALQRAGMAPERRRFAPHVTLARVDQVPEAKLARWVQAHSLFRAEPVLVEHFTLFSSQLGKEFAVYTPEVDYALA
ncbi:MAG: RNA 2',3'-cyclic phosphodiesterase [Acetobacteraceae bacterium]|nr:RNA 2',3'-cyclic phosphodiesterase [Acetobacteraceae bacterium]